MQKETEKFNNTDIMEGMSSISAVISAIKSNITDRKIISVYVDKSKKESKKKELAFLSHKAHELNFNIEYVDDSVISEVTTGNSHGGIIAFWIYFMLDGVEDPYNFGYSVRSIYASGANGLIIPPRNWMGVSGVVARSSAGTSELLDMRVCEASSAIDIFKKRGYTVVCAGIRDSVSLFDAE